MVENEDLQKEIDAEKRRLEELEEKVKRQKGLDLSEALISSLSSLENMKQDMASLQEQMTNTQQVLNNADKSFNAILDLLEHHVANNREVTEELLKYMKNWS